MCIKPNTVETVEADTTGVPLYPSFINKELFPSPAH